MKPNERTVLRVAGTALGSAGVSPVGDGVLAVADFLKACFGETPKPTRETRALPRHLIAMAL
jgi:hypothetical protein